MRTIHKVLVANRGEIALRVMRTCRAMGIATVAVYSDADADAPFVKFADEAVRIGPPPARESYLVINALLDAARKTGADAREEGRRDMDPTYYPLLFADDQIPVPYLKSGLSDEDLEAALKHGVPRFVMVSTDEGFSWPMTDERKKRANDGIVALYDYVDGLVQRRRRDPGDDLVSALVQVEEAGDRLSQDELLAMVVNIIGGAVGSSEAAISNAAYLFALHPDQAQIVQDEVRVSGKKRDDLQAMIQALRAEDFGVALQFVNFRE